MQPVAQRLAAVRAVMARRGYAALIVPRADAYLGEYIPAHSERLRWLTGFSGSAGLALILPRRAGIFVDGRYTAQVRSQVSAELFDYCHLVDQPPEAWLLQHLQAGAQVACDPRLHTLHWFRETRSTLAAGGIELVADSDNLVDCCWRDRPAPVTRRALLLDQRFSGESSLDKRRRVAREIASRGADASLVFAPDAVSWLLNLRGRDVPRLPVLQCCALLYSDAQLTLLVDPARVPQGLAAHLGEGVRVLPEAAAAEVFAACRGRTVLADPHSANAWTQMLLEQCGATLLAADDPVLLPKACKNAVELAGARRAHVRDAVAVVRFLAWLDAEVAAGRLHDEAVLADRLYALRAGGEHFHDLSFDTISAAGANAAMAHYNHLNAVPAPLAMDCVYLVDSGGQYTDGTTDVTRTVAIGDPGAAVRRMFTLVLKGHIALARARFPAGTTGTQVDALARQFLWREGCDYDHGTGHGVGVFLSVHEGPQRISKVASDVALRPGMIVSNEPGYYCDGAYGIRCENLVAVREAAIEGASHPMLEFETLTLVPFDVRLLDESLVSGDELDWLNAYHRRVAATIGPLLDGADLAWLQRATRPLPA
ncbi:MAG: aminopeptidase P family protein [Halioglobus sp.]|nr:aminopeptidase P family protein [Halioglobus sp.]